MAELPRNVKATNPADGPGGSLSSDTTTMEVTLRSNQEGEEKVGDHQPVSNAENQDFTNDAYMFRSLGKTMRRKIKRLGESFHYQSFFRSRHDLNEQEENVEGQCENSGNNETASPAQQEQQQLIKFELSHVPFDQYCEMTRLVWSSLRIPFYTLCRDQQGRHAVPIILSLIRVIGLMVSYYSVGNFGRFFRRYFG